MHAFRARCVKAKTSLSFRNTIIDHMELSSRSVAEGNLNINLEIYLSVYVCPSEELIAKMNTKRVNTLTSMIMILDNCT